MQTPRASQAMGGDGHGHGGFDTRAVWSPSGGWYADPRHWRRNTAVAFGVLAVVSYGIASVSAKLEQRPLAPIRPIPSQRWCDNFPKEEAKK